MPNVITETSHLRLHPPTVLRLLGVSALFLCLSPLLPGPDLSTAFRIGACVSLLSICILLPVALRVSTRSVAVPFPGTPFVILNFVYFALSSLVPLVYPNAYYGAISFAALGPSLLILALAFLCFDLGIMLAGRAVDVRRSTMTHIGRISGLGGLTVVGLAVVWTMRIVLAKMGFGITHAPSLVGTDPLVSEISVVAQSLAYVPLAFCLSRICSPVVCPAEFRLWRAWFFCVFVTDVAYYVLAGSRLGLLWEVLIPAWVLWCRGVRVLPRTLKPVLTVALVGVIPLIYGQRAALEEARPQLGEDHLKLTRQYLPTAEGSLVGSNLGPAIAQGVATDAGRLTAVGPLSGVADRVLNGNYSLMWGETLAAEAPLLVPRLLWSEKSVGEKIEYIINRHFNLDSLDELSTCEMELLANFGVFGLCLGLLLYGFATQRICRPLSVISAVSEPTLFLVLCAMPLVFRVETDIASIFAGLRPIIPIWLILRVFEQKRPLCES